MKKTLFHTFVFTLVLSSSVQGQNSNGAIDAPGDIAFVAYHNDDGASDQDDGFSFILLDDAPNGTTILFLDDEWNGSAFASASGEGELTWTNNTGSTLSKGTVISITSADQDTPTISGSGSISNTEDGFGTSGSDHLFATTGTNRSSPGTFLAYFGRDTDISFDGTGLAAGFTALVTNASPSEGYYNGSTSISGSVLSLARTINDISNWAVGEYTFPTQVPTTFTGTSITSSANIVTFEDEGYSATAPVDLDDFELTNNSVVFQFSSNGTPEPGFEYRGTELTTSFGGYAGGIIIFQGNGPTTAIIKTKDGSSFDFESIDFVNDFITFDCCSLVIRVTGYSSSSIVSGATFDTAIGKTTVLTTLDASGNDNFNSVDEIRVEFVSGSSGATSMQGHGLDNFVWQAAAASTPTSATVAATVFLEGAYNGTDLNTSLNSSIPLTQPYTNNGHSGGSAVSIPANAVDWVLVELREAGSAAAALNSTKVGSTAGFLMNDGTIKATDGTSDLTISLSGNSGADFFVVIYHRNHLPIMSASAISESSGTYTIDFTSSSANTHQTTTALASLSGGKFGMPSGDADGDGDVDGTDLTTWRSQNGSGFTYNTTNADFNLDGVINAVDRNLFWKSNNMATKTSQVPTT